MSRKQRVARLRDNPTDDLLHRTALLPPDVVRGSLREAFPWTPNGDVAGRLAALSTEVLQFTALRSGADAPLIAQEIGRRGAAFTLAEQGGWTDADPLSDNSVRMVRQALECDQTLTLDQLKQITGSRFCDGIVRRIADLDDATAAQLAAQVHLWEAERLAAGNLTPVSALTALAERGPSIAWMVIRDPRATAQTIAAIAEHHRDQAWSHVTITALTHPNVDVALLPVALLVTREHSRARMQGYLDARLGVGTAERRIADRVQETFPGTLNDLLGVVAAIHSTLC
ncbi:hypothetical protein [Geodermatophilus sabuli]|nr:hypothetical protein [Geodermatophilus sabuli]MBB3084194.1 hypothetical protein [Geodermatophilus sabuli]